MSNVSRMVAAAVLAGLLAPGLVACAGSVATGDGSRVRLRSDAFAAYAERVFRQQNEVLDELAFAIEANPQDTDLTALEDRVVAACAGLNAIAVRRRDGGGVRPLRDAAAARSVPDCEAAAVQAAGTLSAAAEP